MKKERYTFTNDDLIGSGQYGQVFRAYDKEKGIMVALKVIQKKKRTQDSSNQLAQEIQTLQKIGWPNENETQNDFSFLIKYYDFYQTPKSYNLVMELFEDSHELLKVIESNGNGVSPMKALEIFYQITRGIRGLHSLNIVHRDLKPANILLRMKPLEVKIVDFGFAKELESGLEQFMTIAGSPIYMSPQNIMGVGYDGKANEIWSLGVLLYQMITGGFPWKVNSMNQLTDELLRFIRDEIKLKLKGLSFEIMDIVADCLQVNEQDRPTAQQLVWKVEKRLLQLKKNMTRINNLKGLPKCDWKSLGMFKQSTKAEFTSLPIRKEKFDQQTIAKTLVKKSQRALNYLTMVSFEPYLNEQDHIIIHFLAFSFFQYSIHILTDKIDDENNPMIFRNMKYFLAQIYQDLDPQEKISFLAFLYIQQQQFEAYQQSTKESLEYLNLKIKNFVINDPKIQDILNFYNSLIQIMMISNEEIQIELFIVFIQKLLS